MTWWDENPPPDPTFNFQTQGQPNPTGWNPVTGSQSPPQYLQAPILGPAAPSLGPTSPGWTGPGFPGGMNPTTGTFNPPAGTTAPPSVTAPTTTAPTGPPKTSDRNAVRQWVIAEAKRLGRDDIAANPDYWVDQAISHSDKGDGTVDTGYWSDRMKSANMGGGGGAGGVGGVAGFGLGGNFGGAGYGGPGGFGGLTAPFTGQAPAFHPPTGLDYTNDPGYQERLKMGTDAIERSAASKGTLLTGGTLKDLTQFAQDFASNEFGNVFNRGLQGFGADMSTFGQNYDIFRNNQNDAFNKLFGVTGLGLNATGQANAALGGYGSGLSGAAGQFADLSKAYGGIGQESANNQTNIGLGLGNDQALAALMGGQNSAAFWQSLANQGVNTIGDLQKWWKDRQSSGTTGNPGGYSA